MLEIGHDAPPFALVDANDASVSLGDLRGSWVVLYFYPKDDTPGCTTEACEFTEGIEAFRGLGARVVGVSPDSPERHRKFIARYQLAVTLLSDPEHVALTAYGAWGEKMMYGKAVVGVKRSTVLIDPQGRIAFHWPNVRARGHAEQVRAKLAELQG